MATYGEPEWATPGSSATGAGATPAPSALAAPTPSTSSGGGDSTGKCVQRTLSILCFGISAMMAALGVFGILDFNFEDASEYSEVFISVYMLIFATLLAAYEFIWWVPVPWINKMLRMNFGFLYGIRGKGFYLIFVAFLTIGLENDVRITGLRLGTGGAFLCVGVLHLFVFFWRPHLVSSYKAPTTGLTGSEAV